MNEIVHIYDEMSKDKIEYTQIVHWNLHIELVWLDWNVESPKNNNVANYTLTHSFSDDYKNIFKRK